MENDSRRAKYVAGRGSQTVTKEDIRNKVFQIVQERRGWTDEEAEEIGYCTPLEDTPPIGIDSLDLVEIVGDIEDEFEVHIIDDVMGVDEYFPPPCSVNDLTEAVVKELSRHDA